MRSTTRPVPSAASPPTALLHLARCSCLHGCSEVRESVLSSVSLGRGRQDGSGRFFSRAIRRVGNVPVVYLRFVHWPVLSKLLSALEPIGVLWHCRHQAKSSTVLFYNRMPGYIPSLIAAVLLGYRTVLDLEDGEVGLPVLSVAGLAARVSRLLFDALCTDGVLLACSALSRMSQVANTLCYYGTIEVQRNAPSWDGDRVTVLLGGTLAQSTGAPLLAQAIRMARGDGSVQWRGLHFVVTGYGESADEFHSLASLQSAPTLEFFGRTTDEEYCQLLRRVQVGLALKPARGLLAHSTFPSKVIELAAAGLLVVTTDISDVRHVLGSGALYLDEERPERLLELLRSVADDPSWARSIARAGTLSVSARCAPSKVGPQVAAFLCGRRI